VQRRLGLLAFGDVLSGTLIEATTLGAWRAVAATLSVSAVTKTSGTSWSCGSALSRRQVS
jgi:hypothetical protein